MRIEHVLHGPLPGCRPEEHLRSAARRMLDLDCGCLMVIGDDPSQPIVGFVTQHDLLAAFLRRPNGHESCVRDAMSEEVELVNAAAIPRALTLAEGPRPLLMLRSHEGAILALFRPVRRDRRIASRRAGLRRCPPTRAPTP